MSTQSMTPAQVVEHYLHTFFKKDVDKTLACLTDDVTWKVQGAAEVPTVGLIQGKPAVREWLALFPQHFQPLEFHAGQIFEHGQQVVVTGSFKHRILATGRTFHSDFAAICTVRGEQVCAYSFLEDSYALWHAFQPV